MSKFVTPLRIWIAVSVGLGIIAIALMGVVIHLKTTEPSGHEEINNFTLYSKYSFMFRTRDEQRAFENQIRHKLVYHACCNSSKLEGLSPAVVQKSMSHSPNGLIFIVYVEMCRKALITLRYIAPNSAVTIYNTNVTVVQNFNNNNAYQWFPEDSCQQADGTCSCRCSCQRQEAYFSALVLYPPPDSILNISLIRLNAFCKCINGELMTRF